MGVWSEAGKGVQGVIGEARGEDSAEYWLQLNMKTLNGVLNDVKQGEYDFVVDTTQLGPTAKMMKFAEATEVINTLPEQLRPYPLWLKQWDNPLSDEWVKFVEQRMGMMEMKQQEQELLAQAGQVAEVKNKMMMPQIAQKKAQMTTQ